MKRLIFTVFICTAATTMFAQSTSSDSAKTAADSTKIEKGTTIKLGYGDDADEVNINKDRKTTDHHSKAPGFSFGITLARFDLGLATFLDNGSFTLSKDNQFLSYRSWKTSNVGFDVLQFSYRFDSAFRIYVSGGFDWTLIRLRQNITILPNQPVLTYRPDNINYSKNRFSSSYLRIPLAFDFRSKDDDNGRRFHFVFGPDAGFLLNGRVKQISKENGKQKFNDDYHFTRFRYGTYARIGYGGWGLFAKYYFNDEFENSPAQKGLKNFSFGIMLGF